MIQTPLPRGPKKHILEFFSALTLAVLVKVISEQLTSGAFWEHLLVILNGRT